MFSVIPSFSCRVYRGIFKISSKKRLSRSQKWQYDVSDYLGSLKISIEVACFQQGIPTGLDIAISACRQYEAIPLFWLVTLAGKMSPSKVCPFWFRASKKSCLRRTRNFWTTAALESQQAAEAGQSKENKNDLRGSTVQQTQVAFFPGSPNNQVIFDSC